MVRILILGGGFGGVRCALDLSRLLGNRGSSILSDSSESGEKNQFEITLIDQNGYHLFTPEVYEVASAYGIKKDPFAVQLRKTVCIPYPDIFAGKRINFIEAEISEVNLKNKIVRTRGEHQLEYDYLVFSLGGETTDFNIPGVKEYAHQFKTLDDALFINQKLDELSLQFTEGKRTEPFSFFICGGGFTGIELASELGCCTKVIKERCRLRGRCSNITLFEAGPKILPMVSDKERRIIKKRLTNLGVIIMENYPIEEVGPDFVKLKNGSRLTGDLIIWTAGLKPNRLLAQISDLAIAPSGKIEVDDELRVKGFENVFAVGANIEFIDSKIQKPVPVMAYVAIDQAKVAARNIVHFINKKPSSKLSRYKPFYGAWVVSVGGKYVVAHLLNNLVIRGFLGWLIKVAIDIRYFMSILPVQKAIKLYWEEFSVFTKND